MLYCISTQVRLVLLSVTIWLWRNKTAQMNQIVIYKARTKLYIMIVTTWYLCCGSLFWGEVKLTQSVSIKQHHCHFVLQHSYRRIAGTSVHVRRPVISPATVKSSPWSKSPARAQLAISPGNTTSRRTTSGTAGNLQQDLTHLWAVMWCSVLVP